MEPGEPVVSVFSLSLTLACDFGLAVQHRLDSPTCLAGKVGSATAVAGHSRIRPAKRRHRLQL